MPKHRTHSIEFKRQVVQDYLGGETLYGLAKRHEISRTLIRVWLAKHEAGVLDSESAYCELNPASNTYANGSAPLSIMHTSLATNQAASFIVSPSLVTGLYTSTTVKSNGGSASSATSTGYVNVTVVMDSGLTAAGKLWDGKTGTVAFPFTTVNATGGTFPGVTFDSRTQTLTATLGQAITSSCLVSGSIATCGAEQITLMLSTTSAHSFYLILPNVGVGPHTIDVIAQVSPETLNMMGTDGSSSSSAACYGAGSVVVDSVRLGNGFSCSSTGCSAN